MRTRCGTLIAVVVALLVGCAPESTEWERVGTAQMVEIDIDGQLGATTTEVTVQTRWRDGLWCVSLVPEDGTGPRGGAWCDASGPPSEENPIVFASEIQWAEVVLEQGNVWETTVVGVSTRPNGTVAVSLFGPSVQVALSPSDDGTRGLFATRWRHASTADGPSIEPEVDLRVPDS